MASATTAIQGRVYGQTDEHQTHDDDISLSHDHVSGLSVLSINSSLWQKLVAVQPDSAEGQRLLKDIRNTYLDTQYSTSLNFEQLLLVRNDVLANRFQEKKRQLHVIGRNSQEMHVFACFKKQESVLAIINEGAMVKSSMYNYLGQSELGVNLCRHADVQLKSAEAGRSRVKRCWLIMFKALMGRSRAIPADASEQYPTLGYDSHISNVRASAEHNLHVQAINSQVYLFEFTNEQRRELAKYPANILPYAVLSFSKNELPQPILPRPVTMSHPPYQQRLQHDRGSNLVQQQQQQGQQGFPGQSSMQVPGPPPLAPITNQLRHLQPGNYAIGPGGVRGSATSSDTRHTAQYTGSSAAAYTYDQPQTTAATNVGSSLPGLMYPPNRIATSTQLPFHTADSTSSTAKYQQMIEKEIYLRQMQEQQIVNTAYTTTTVSSNVMASINHRPQSNQTLSQGQPSMGMRLPTIVASTQPPQIPVVSANSNLTNRTAPIPRTLQSGITQQPTSNIVQSENSASAYPNNVITIQPEGTAPYEYPSYQGVWPWIKQEPISSGNTSTDDPYSYTKYLKDSDAGTETRPIIIEPIDILPSTSETISGQHSSLFSPTDPSSVHKGSTTTTTVSTSKSTVVTSQISSAEAIVPVTTTSEIPTSGTTSQVTSEKSDNIADAVNLQSLNSEPLSDWEEFQKLYGSSRNREDVENVCSPVRTTSGDAISTQSYHRNNSNTDICYTNAMSNTSPNNKKSVHHLTEPGTSRPRPSVVNVTSTWDVPLMVNKTNIKSSNNCTSATLVYRRKSSTEINVNNDQDMINVVNSMDTVPSSNAVNVINSRDSVMSTNSETGASSRELVISTNGGTAGLRSRELVMSTNSGTAGLSTGELVISTNSGTAGLRTGELVMSTNSGTAGLSTELVMSTNSETAGLRTGELVMSTNSETAGLRTGELVMSTNSGTVVSLRSMAVSSNPLTVLSSRDTTESSNHVTVFSSRGTEVSSNPLTVATSMDTVVSSQPVVSSTDIILSSNSKDTIVSSKALSSAHKSINCNITTESNPLTSSLLCNTSPAVTSCSSLSSVPTPCSSSFFSASVTQCTLSGTSVITTATSVITTVVSTSTMSMSTTTMSTSATSTKALFSSEVAVTTESLLASTRVERAPGSNIANSEKITIPLVEPKSPTSIIVSEKGGTEPKQKNTTKILDNQQKEFLSCQIDHNTSSSMSSSSSSRSESNNLQCGDLVNVANSKSGSQKKSAQTEPDHQNGENTPVELNAVQSSDPVNIYTRNLTVNVDNSVEQINNISIAKMRRSSSMADETSSTASDKMEQRRKKKKLKNKSQRNLPKISSSMRKVLETQKVVVVDDGSIHLVVETLYQQASDQSVNSTTKDGHLLNIANKSREKENRKLKDKPSSLKKMEESYTPNAETKVPVVSSKKIPMSKKSCSPRPRSSPMKKFILNKSKESKKSSAVKSICCSSTNLNLPKPMVTPEDRIEAHSNSKGHYSGDSSDKEEFTSVPKLSFGVLKNYMGIGNISPAVQSVGVNRDIDSVNRDTCNMNWDADGVSKDTDNVNREADSEVQEMPSHIDINSALTSPKYQPVVRIECDILKYLHKYNLYNPSVILKYPPPKEIPLDPQDIDITGPNELTLKISQVTSLEQVGLTEKNVGPALSQTTNKAFLCDHDIGSDSDIPRSRTVTVKGGKSEFNKMQITIKPSPFSSKTILDTEGTGDTETDVYVNAGGIGKHKKKKKKTKKKSKDKVQTLVVHTKKGRAILNSETSDADQENITPQVKMVVKSKKEESSKINTTKPQQVNTFSNVQSESDSDVLRKKKKRKGRILSKAYVESSDESGNETFGTILISPARVVSPIKLVKKNISDQDFRVLSKTEQQQLNKECRDAANNNRNEYNKAYDPQEKHDSDQLKVEEISYSKPNQTVQQINMSTAPVKRDVKKISHSENYPVKEETVLAKQEEICQSGNDPIEQVNDNKAIGTAVLPDVVLSSKEVFDDTPGKLTTDTVGRVLGEVTVIKNLDSKPSVDSDQIDQFLKHCRAEQDKITCGKVQIKSSRSTSIDSLKGRRSKKRNRSRSYSRSPSKERHRRRWTRSRSRSRSRSPSFRRGKYSRRYSRSPSPYRRKRYSRSPSPYRYKHKKSKSPRHNSPRSPRRYYDSPRRRFSRSSSPRRKHSRSRSFSPRRRHSRSRSRSRRKFSRSRSRSPRRKHSRSRSLSPRRKHTRSSSTSPRRRHTRSRSPTPRRKRSRSRSLSPKRRYSRSSSYKGFKSMSRSPTPIKQLKTISPGSRPYSPSSPTESPSKELVKQVAEKRGKTHVDELFDIAYGKTVVSSSKSDSNLLPTDAKTSPAISTSQDSSATVPNISDSSGIDVASTGTHTVKEDGKLAAKTKLSFSQYKKRHSKGSMDSSVEIDEKSDQSLSKVKDKIRGMDCKNVNNEDADIASIDRQYKQLKVTIDSMPADEDKLEFMIEYKRLGDQLRQLRAEKSGKADMSVPQPLEPLNVSPKKQLSQQSTTSPLSPRGKNPLAPGLFRSSSDITDKPDWDISSFDSEHERITERFNAYKSPNEKLTSTPTVNVNALLDSLQGVPDKLGLKPIVPTSSVSENVVQNILNMAKAQSDSAFLKVTPTTPEVRMHDFGKNTVNFQRSISTPAQSMEHPTFYTGIHKNPQVFQKPLPHHARDPRLNRKESPDTAGHTAGHSPRESTSVSPKGMNSPRVSSVSHQSMGSPPSAFQQHQQKILQIPPDSHHHQQQQSVYNPPPLNRQHPPQHQSYPQQNQHPHSHGYSHSYFGAPHGSHQHVNQPEPLRLIPITVPEINYEGMQGNIDDPRFLPRDQEVWNPIPTKFPRIIPWEIENAEGVCDMDIETDTDTDTEECYYTPPPVKRNDKPPIEQCLVTSLNTCNSLFESDHQINLQRISSTNNQKNEVQNDTLELEVDTKISGIMMSKTESVKPDMSIGKLIEIAENSKTKVASCSEKDKVNQTGKSDLPFKGEQSTQKSYSDVTHTQEQETSSSDNDNILSNTSSPVITAEKSESYDTFIVSRNVGVANRQTVTLINSVEALSANELDQFSIEMNRQLDVTLGYINQEKLFYNPTRDIPKEMMQKVIDDANLDQTTLTELKLEFHLVQLDKVIKAVKENIETYRIRMNFPDCPSDVTTNYEQSEERLHAVELAREYEQKRLETELRRYQKAELIEVIPAEFLLQGEVGGYISEEGCLMFLTERLRLEDCRNLYAYKVEIESCKEKLEKTSGTNLAMVRKLRKMIGYWHSQRKLLLINICCASTKKKQELTESFIDKLAWYRVVQSEVEKTASKINEVMLTFVVNRIEVVEAYLHVLRHVHLNRNVWESTGNSEDKSTDAKHPSNSVAVSSTSIEKSANNVKIGSSHLLCAPQRDKSPRNAKTVVKDSQKTVDKNTKAVSSIVRSDWENTAKHIGNFNMPSQSTKEKVHSDSSNSINNNNKKHFKRSTKALISDQCSSVIETVSNEKKIREIHKNNNNCNVAKSVESCTVISNHESNLNPTSSNSAKVKIDTKPGGKHRSSHSSKVSVDSNVKTPHEQHQKSSSSTNPDKISEKRKSVEGKNSTKTSIKSSEQPQKSSGTNPDKISEKRKSVDGIGKKEKRINSILELNKEVDTNHQNLKTAKSEQSLNKTGDTDSEKLVKSNLKHSKSKHTVKRSSSKEGHVKKEHSKEGHVIVKESHINEGHVKEGPIKEGHVKEGPIKEGHVKEGSIKEGHIKEGHKERHIKEGHSKEGHIKQSNSKESHVKQGNSKEGHVKQGNSKEGHVKQSHSKGGHLKQGHSKEGHVKQGHSKEGPVNQGHNKKGHVKQDHCKEGLVKQGHSKEVHVKQGHCKEGHVKQAHSKEKHAKESHHEEKHVKEPQFAKDSHSTEGQDKEGSNLGAQNKKIYVKEAHSNEGSSKEAHGKEGSSTEARGKEGSSKEVHGKEAHGKKGSSKEPHGKEAQLKIVKNTHNKSKGGHSPKVTSDKTSNENKEKIHKVVKTNKSEHENLKPQSTKSSEHVDNKVKKDNIIIKETPNTDLQKLIKDADKSFKKDSIKRQNSDKLFHQKTKADNTLIKSDTQKAVSGSEYNVTDHCKDKINEDANMAKLDSSHKSKKLKHLSDDFYKESRVNKEKTKSVSSSHLKYPETTRMAPKKTVIVSKPAPLEEPLKICEISVFKKNQKLKASFSRSTSREKSKERQELKEIDPLPDLADKSKLSTLSKAANSVRTKKVSVNIPKLVLKGSERNISVFEPEKKVTEASSRCCKNRKNQENEVSIAVTKVKTDDKSGNTQVIPHNATSNKLNYQMVKDNDITSVGLTSVNITGSSMSRKENPSDTGTKSVETNDSLIQSSKVIQPTHSSISMSSNVNTKVTCTASSKVTSSLGDDKSITSVPNSLTKVVTDSESCLKSDSKTKSRDSKSNNKTICVSKPRRSSNATTAHENHNLSLKRGRSPECISPLISLKKQKLSGEEEIVNMLSSPVDSKLSSKSEQQYLTVGHFKKSAVKGTNKRPRSQSPFQDIASLESSKSKNIDIGIADPHTGRTSQSSAVGASVNKQPRSQSPSQDIVSSESTGNKNLPSETEEVKIELSRGKRQASHRSQPSSSRDFIRSENELSKSRRSPIRYFDRSDSPSRRYTSPRRGRPSVRKQWPEQRSSSLNHVSPPWTNSPERQRWSPSRKRSPFRNSPDVDRYRYNDSWSDRHARSPSPKERSPESTCSERSKGKHRSSSPYDRDRQDIFVRKSPRTCPRTSADRDRYSSEEFEGLSVKINNTDSDNDERIVQPSGRERGRGRSRLGSRNRQQGRGRSRGSPSRSRIPYGRGRSPQKRYYVGGTDFPHDQDERIRPANSAWSSRTDGGHSGRGFSRRLGPGRSDMDERRIQQYEEQNEVINNALLNMSNLLTEGIKRLQPWQQNQIPNLMSVEQPKNDRLQYPMLNQNRMDNQLLTNQFAHFAEMRGQGNILSLMNCNDIPQNDIGPQFHQEPLFTQQQRQHQELINQYERQGMIEYENQRNMHEQETILRRNHSLTRVIDGMLLRDQRSMNM